MPSSAFLNLGILAHVDAGKTTLTERMLFAAGSIREAGSVDDGSTRTDSLSVERERGISVRTATASLFWHGKTVNIIDTPGHVDFAGEVERCLGALDIAIVVVSAPDGVRAHTENILRALDLCHTPRVLFVNKIDRAGAEQSAPDSAVLSAALRRVTGAEMTYMNAQYVSDIATARATVHLRPIAEAATEALAEFDPEAEEAFLTDTVLPDDAAREKLCAAIRDCRITPILWGCAKNGTGVTELLDFCTDFMPDAADRASDALSGVIFKIEHDRTMGKLAYIRLFGGSLKSRDSVTLIDPAAQTAAADLDPDDAVPACDDTPAAPWKITQIRRADAQNGGKFTDAGAISAGDIGVLCGLTGAKCGNFVGAVTGNTTARLAYPLLSVQVRPTAEEEAKMPGEALPSLANAMRELSEEEPYLDAKWENGQSEIVVHLTGGVQQEILENLLWERYGKRAVFSKPTVIYKETPTREGIAYADYTMPKPCWAVVQFKFTPMPRGYGVSYHGRLPSNQLFYRYQSHIRRSFRECLAQGLHGWEVTDFRCDLIGGEHHTIHTHPLDFFVCTPMAFMNGLVNCGTTLLEPLMRWRITCPMELSGKILSQVTNLRGTYDTPVVAGDTASMEAILPLATTMHFPIWLASTTSGKAACASDFYGYSECPPGEMHETPRRGVNPLDRAKWILYCRGAGKWEG